MARLDHLTDMTVRDFLYFMVGEKIGEGMSREVYTIKGMPDKVLKIETGSYFQNVKEYELWDDVQHIPNMARWFAPVHFISGFGSSLIMGRTEPIPTKYYPKSLPRDICDLKKENFGFYKGKIVCHDYGTLRSISSTRMKKVSWQTSF